MILILFFKRYLVIGLETKAQIKQLEQKYYIEAAGREEKKKNYRSEVKKRKEVLNLYFKIYIF